MGTDVIMILVVLLILEICLVIAVFAQASKIRKLTAKTNSLSKGQTRVPLSENDGKDLSRRIGRLDRYAKNIGSMDDSIARLQDIAQHSVHKYGIVKYDAFDDVGGKLSFALAMLDDFDSGFVLNAVHSKENCFLYIKEIVKGESYIMLSNEEVEALRIARRYGSDNLTDE